MKKGKLKSQMNLGSSIDFDPQVLSLVARPIFLENKDMIEYLSRQLIEYAEDKGVQLEIELKFDLCPKKEWVN